MTRISILRRRQVEEETGLPRASIYEKIKRGEFPRPVPLGSRSVGWVSTEISEWVESRIKARPSKVVR